MSTIGIELCDEGVLAANVENRTPLIPLEETRLASPAFVRFNGREFRAGQEVEDICRIHPKFFTDDCWDQLSLRTSDLMASGKTPHYSELAYHHFRTIWERLNATGNPIDRVVLAVPGYYLLGEFGDEEKVGLLLGMIADLQIPLAGIIDMAVASLAGERGAALESAGRVLHLDIHQHATLITVLNCSDKVSREEIIRIPNTGYSEILGDLIPKLANQFLSKTAFDIHHAAETEQSFYNQTRGLLHRLKIQTEGTLELVRLRRPRKMLVSRDALARHLAQIIEKIQRQVLRVAHTQIAGASPVTLLMTERTARIPGLKESLAHTGKFAVSELEEGVAALGASRFGLSRTVITDLEDAPLTISCHNSDLGLAGPSSSSALARPEPQIADGEAKQAGAQVPAAELESSTQPATHLVWRGMAHRLNEQDFWIGSDLPEGQHGLSLPDGSASLSKHHCSIRRDNRHTIITLEGNSGAWLNDDRITGHTAVKPGDQLVLGDATFNVTFLFIHCRN